MLGLAMIAVSAVIPILPAVHSVLVVLVLCGSALLAALFGLRNRSTWASALRFCWRQKWSLLSLGIVGWAGVAASGWVIDSLRGVPTRRAEVSGDWPHRGGNSRRAALRDSPSPTAGGIRWSGGAGDAFFSSPGVVGHRVFGVGFRGDRGRFYCWDAQSGRQLWTASPSGFRATFSSPVIAGSCLYIGEGLHHTRDASVFCLDLRSGREGDVLWSLATNSHVECTPVCDEQRVYVAAGDDGIYCLSRADDVDDARRVIWHAPGARYPDVETALAVHQDRVYVGLGEGQGGQALAVLDAANGSELSRLPMPYPVHSPPAIVADRLYLGMGTGNYVDHKGSRGRIACIDRNTLDIVWTFDVPGTVLGAVVCDGDEVLFGCADGRVIAIDEHGEMSRDWNSRAAIVAAPAVTNDMLYVVNVAGVLYGLDRRSLQPVWETRLGPPGQYVSSPVVAHGHVYVGAGRDGFVCVGAPTAGRVSPTAGLPERGEVLWTYRFEGPLSGPPGITHSAIVVSLDNADHQRIVSLANRGESLPVERASFPTDLSLPNRITTVDEIAMIASGSRLSAFDAPTMRLLWQTAARARSAPVVEGATLWIKTNDETDSSLPCWEIRSVTDGSLVAESAAAPRVSSDSILKIDGTRILRQHRNGDSPIVWADCASLGDIDTRPLIHNRRVYVCIGRRLVCLGEADRR